MKPLDVINGLRVASPCSMAWDAMEGDDRSRYCGACEKYVYNIAALKTPEIIDLIRDTQGEFCGQIYRRPDGTVLTGDCPVGIRAYVTRRLRGLLTLVIVGAGTGWAAVAPRSRTSPDLTPEGPGVAVDDWFCWARQNLGSDRRSNRGAVRGKLIAVPGGIRAMPMTACGQDDGAP